MTQIKKFQTAPGALPVPPKSKNATYYSGSPVTNTYVIPADDGSRLASVSFSTPRGQYDVDTYTWNDGKNRLVSEYGTNNGVSVEIDNAYGPDGMVQKSDTTYNGLRRGEVGYEQLQRQYEDDPYNTIEEGEPLFPGTPDAEINQQTTPSTSQEPRWKQVASTAAKYLFPGAHALVKIGQKAAQVGTSRMKQGGYLRLQKQGGKLTEVWTPFN